MKGEVRRDSVLHIYERLDRKNCQILTLRASSFFIGEASLGVAPLRSQDPQVRMT